MSKAKELATKIRRYIDRRHTSWYFGGVRHELYELLEIILADDAVLSEPEPLKGWIEVQCAYTNALRTINCKNIVSFGTSKKEQTYIDLVQFDDAIIVQESYDSIKQKIKEAS